MQKRELKDSSMVGTVNPSSKNQHAWSLLGAAPFSLRDNKEFIWYDTSLCKSLLRISQNSLPDTSWAWAQRLSPEDNRKREKALGGLTWDGAQYSVTYEIMMDDARKIWVHERGERLSGEGAIATHVSGVIVNVDAYQKAQLRAGYLAHHDELTGLWNLSRIKEGLNHIIAHTRRCRSQALCLRVRVSNLTDINRTYGYEVSDNLLKAIASRLEGFTRLPDVIGRISGVSFALGLYETKAEDAEAVAARLREILSDTPYPSAHGPLFVDVDIASTTLGEQAHSAMEALAQTQVAMQSGSKANQKIVRFTPEMAKLHRARRSNETTEDDILSALNDRRISLAFQPIVDAQTRDLHHYECLLRLRTDEGEVVSAGKFIMAAERLGLVHMLDRRALELAGETLRQYPDIHIALNVSAGTVKNLETADAYIAALKALGPDAKRVTLELTETVALEDPAMASRFSVETRTLGCEFAIDDFGSGYTTFRNLMAIEADTIKIDGTFIEGIAHTPHKETFVRMMVDLAQTFSVKTVAEMVDSRADADLLKRLGVNYLQGYMFGIPSAAPAWRRAS
jgi:diguanylate cyclase (GGDEF)-like protein